MKTTDDQMILSSISDQGQVPKEDLPKILTVSGVDKASRAQEWNWFRIASIAKEIIKQHNGFIWAKSEYGKAQPLLLRFLMIRMQ